jgi:hypothetical protein
MIQAKLRIGQPNDKYEQEADRVAEQVMRMPEPRLQRQVEPEEQEEETLQAKRLTEQITPLVQRQVEPEEEEEEEAVQTKLADGMQMQRQEEPEEEEEEPIQTKQVSTRASEVTPNLASRIQSLKGGGQPLPRSVRAFFEPRFGHNFSQVRVHTDAEAAETARVLNAQAFTTGHNVIFGAGQYGPGTSTGNRLLSHELTHVIQQSQRPLKLQPDFHLLSQTAEPIIQLQPQAQPITWQKRLQQAQQLKKQNTKATRNQSRTLYKNLVIEATRSIPTVKGLPIYKSPALKDIRWSWKLPGHWGALTDNRWIFRYATDSWKWFLFSPAAVNEDKAWTIGALVHELDHAAHGYQIFLKWKAKYPKGNENAWKQYWVSHHGRFTEVPIKLIQMGILSVLSGLPTKIRPSLIEFRAYANQFVKFFHKYSLKSQALNAKGVILFYPLKKQTVRASISDPTLNLSAARKNVLDYFRNPPGKTPAEKQILKVRMADEVAYASILRPSLDRSTIKNDFKPIFDFITKLKDKRALGWVRVGASKVRGRTNEWKVEREKARKNYKPQ